jgi:hypothetical protein
MSFCSPIFGMRKTTANDSLSIELRQALERTSKTSKLHNHHIVISDKDLIGSHLQYWDGILTIKGDEYVVEYKHTRGVAQEDCWQQMPITKKHLDDMKKKGSLFYLYAYEKDSLKRFNYTQPKYCTRIVEVHTIENDGYTQLHVQLPDPKSSEVKERIYTKNIRVINIFIVGVFFALYHYGFIDKMTRFFNYEISA